jgi:hypothetical protein
MARRLRLNNRMGLLADDKPVSPPLAHFSGPGVAYVGFGEYNQRAMLRAWADCLETPVAPPEPVDLGGTS